MFSVFTFSKRKDTIRYPFFFMTDIGGGFVCIKFDYFSF